jgi:uncharacterized nucleotidyltransferase DUF6036
MQANRDFKDLFAELNARSVEFLVVGAHALAAHGYVRATKDLDVWVRPATANAERVIAALQGFGAPTHGVTSADFATPGVTFQIGVAPVRIDIITAVDGLTFEPAWERRVASDYGGEPVFVLSREDLIVNKRASGRPQDLVDIAELERRS